MKLNAILGLSSLLALQIACGGSTPPAEGPTDGATETPADPAPADGVSAGDTDCKQHAANSPEHCECLGGYVKGDIGDGKVACTDGDTEIERTNSGIEGAVCCQKAAQ